VTAEVTCAGIAAMIDQRYTGAARVLSELGPSDCHVGVEDQSAERGARTEGAPRAAGRYEVVRSHRAAEAGTRLAQRVGTSRTGRQG
jgi:hypothetical protein